ncbi:protein MRG1-like isoform X1 [Syzygium oleosum]|uniref:protein MRG1-like isoform X1 n=1 Tax=Syzygium oleosum TaxID=219896 RepID=UPI0024B9635D|nr:protein MRG1-like isoform X1 [Syzygium oleosum]XP_056173125.1 protein MRG1-like isoform X1 [Syzygium oleosum]
MGSSKSGFDGDSASESYGGAATESDAEGDRDDGCPPALESSPFAEEEKVLAFHSLHIYEAKVKKIEYRLREWRYYVHYLGWSKNWDEWVGVDRLMKYTDENLQKQRELNNKQDAEKTTKPSRASHTKPKGSNVPRGKKRKNDSILKEKSALPSEKLVNIQIPPTLKKQLIDDCEFVTHLGKLVRLPRAPSVDDILKKYLDYRLKKDGIFLYQCRMADCVGEIMKGLRCYFDKALPVMLLYKSERQQYEETVVDDVDPSTIYGAEHLLRLFVKLPELLVYANIEEETLRELQHKLNDFLKFLQKNQSLFFLSAYNVREEIETSTNNLVD